MKAKRAPYRIFFYEYEGGALLNDTDSWASNKKETCLALNFAFGLFYVGRKRVNFLKTS